MKNCPSCHTVKPDNCFSKNRCTRDGLQGHCKACKSERHKQYMKDPEIHKRVVSRTLEWQKGVGKEKWKATLKKYHTSKKG